MGLQFDTSSGKMPFGMKMPSCEIKIKGPSMEIELDAELEVEVDASIEIDVDVEVQIKGPSMEIELDVEIDVKLKQPIESEAEEYGFKICGGYLEQGHNLKRGKRDTPHYHCSIIEAMQICMANPDEAIGITWNGDKFPTGEVDVFIKNDSCKAEVFPGDGWHTLMMEGFHGAIKDHGGMSVDVHVEVPCVEIEVKAPEICFDGGVTQKTQCVEVEVPGHTVEVHTVHVPSHTKSVEVDTTEIEARIRAEMQDQMQTQMAAQMATMKAEMHAKAEESQAHLKASFEASAAASAAQMHADFSAKCADAVAHAVAERDIHAQAQSQLQIQAAIAAAAAAVANFQVDGHMELDAHCGVDLDVPAPSLNFNYSASPGKVHGGMRVKAPSMCIELELEVDLGACLDVKVKGPSFGMGVEVKAPCVELKGPSICIELEVEAPCVDLKVKAPSFGMGVEVEAPCVDISLDMDAKVKGPSFGFEVKAPCVEVEIKAPCCFEVKAPCLEVEIKANACIEAEEASAWARFEHASKASEPVKCTVKAPVQAAAPVQQECAPEHPEVLSMAARIQANKENGPIFGRMAPPAHFHAPHPMHYGAPGMHHAPMPMRPPSPPPRDPRAMSPGPVSAAAAGRLQGQHDAAVRYGSPLSSPRGVPAGYGYGAHGHVAGYGGHMHPGAHGYHMQHAGYEMQRDMNTRQLDADVRGLSAAQRIHSHTSYTTQASTQSTTQDK